MQLEHAADAAVRANRLGHRLPRLVPCARLPHVVLALEHERPGRADPDAVPAVDARRVGELHCELCGDVRIEASTGDADGERVLRVDAAGLDALVAKNAARVVAHVELVVDLHGLGHGGGPRPEALRLRAVSSYSAVHLTRAPSHIPGRG